MREVPCIAGVYGKTVPGLPMVRSSGEITPNKSLARHEESVEMREREHGDIPAPNNGGVRDFYLLLPTGAVISTLPAIKTY